MLIFNNNKISSLLILILLKLPLNFAFYLYAWFQQNPSYNIMNARAVSDTSGTVDYNVLSFCAWKNFKVLNITTNIFKGNKSISDCFTIFSIPKILRCFRDAKEETVPSPHVPCTQHPIIFFRLF